MRGWSKAKIETAPEQVSKSTGLFGSSQSAKRGCTLSDKMTRISKTSSDPRAVHSKIFQFSEGKNPLEATITPDRPAVEPRKRASRMSALEEILLQNSSGLDCGASF
jgi:hypothetical protein